MLRIARRRDDASTWMRSDEAKRLRELVLENGRLKELVAESELDKRILKEALEGNY